MNEFFVEKDGVLHCEDVALTDIAKAHSTPAYIYSLASIKSQYEKLSKALSDVIPADKAPMLCYACKANSNVAVLSALRQMGSGLEIVSEGELRRGLKAGFPAEKIVSTGVGKQHGEIAALLNAGVHQINVESLPELHKIQEVASEINKKAIVVFRLNPDVSGGGHHKISTGRKRDKFGLGRKSIFEGFEAARNMSHVEAVGLSIHIGSQVFTVESFKQAFENLPELVEELRGHGHTVERIDIGGGFPIKYKDENLLDLNAYAAWVRDIILPLDVEIIMEPGRYLVGNAGALLTEVLYVKETDERQFLIIDAAMNDLIRPTLYDAWHDIESVQNRSAAIQTYDVVGPICETGDTFTTDRQLPQMSAGDLAIIKSAGAYGFCMASNYNTRATPPEILVNGSEFAVIRERQDVDEIIDLDKIPDWLSD